MGFFGVKCEQRHSACALESRDAPYCRNGGVCADSHTPYEFTCVCPEEWTGGRCEVAGTLPTTMSKLEVIGIALCVVIALSAGTVTAGLLVRCSCREK